MMIRTNSSCILILLAVFGITEAFLGFRSDNRREQDELWKSLTINLRYLKAQHRPLFLIQCTRSYTCTNKSVGNANATFNWAAGTSKTSKDRFWQTYQCFRERSLQNCPVDGMWGAWTSWNKCDANCGAMSKSQRTRLCNNPLPLNKGSSCRGFHTNLKSCKGACSNKTTNAVSMSMMEAKAFLDKVHHGFPHLFSACIISHCSFDLLDRITSLEAKDKYWSSLQCYKYQRACPVDGRWSTWGVWSNCEPKCGTGTRWRIRNCTSPHPQNAGFDCVGSNFMREPCFGKQCSKTEFFFGNHLSDWSLFGQCSVSCGQYGTMEKRRICLVSGKCENQIGKDKDEVVVQKPCFNGPCSSEGGWSAWWEYTKCSADCGIGRQVRIRRCDSPLPVGSASCIGPDTNSRLCNVTCVVDKWSEVQNGTNSTDLKLKSSVSNASPTAKLPVYGQSYEYEVNPSIEHLFTYWSEWSVCSKSCDVGQRTRTRKCRAEGLCYGEVRQQDMCNTAKCPVPGGWSEWLGWTQCSTTCGKGIRMRYRKCDSPFPKNGGTCVGSHEESKHCSKPNCTAPVLKYGTWQKWSPCTQSCGIGSRSRHRYCMANTTKKTVKEVFLGKDANELCKDGTAREKGVCNPYPCPVAGDWAHWSSWSSCSHSCGLGFHHRDRTCTDPSPLHRGRSCPGPGSEIQHCFHGPCPAQDDVCVLTNGSTWMQYEPLGVPLSYLSVFVSFNPRLLHGTLMYRYPLCTKPKCEDYVKISMQTGKPRLNLHMNGGDLTILTNDTIELRNWHTLFVYVTGDSGFIRVDNGPHYNAKFDPKPDDIINFDGYMLIGSDRKKGFAGYIAHVHVNFVDMVLSKMQDWTGYGAPVEQAFNKMEIVDPTVNYPKFGGKTFLKLPLNDSALLDLQFSFVASKLNGLLFFNEGLVPGSFVYAFLSRGVLRFCMNSRKKTICENIETIAPMRWYNVDVSIHGNMATIRLNQGKATQMACPGKHYRVGFNLFLGGGQKHDWTVFNAVIGGTSGFHGTFHDILLNGQHYPVSTRLLMDNDGFMNSESLKADRIDSVLEHSNSMVILRCDYTTYMKAGHDVSVEWMRVDEVIKSSASEVITPRIAGQRYVSSLTLSPKKHKNGLYICVVHHDGHLTNQHMFVLERHKVDFYYWSGDLELLRVKEFLVFFTIVCIILLCCIAPFNIKSYRRSMLKAVLKRMKKLNQIRKRKRMKQEHDDAVDKEDKEITRVKDEEDDLEEFADELLHGMEEEKDEDIVDGDEFINEVYLSDNERPIDEQLSMQSQSSVSESDEEGEETLVFRGSYHHGANTKDSPDNSYRSFSSPKTSTPTMIPSPKVSTPTTTAPSQRSSQDRCQPSIQPSNFMSRSRMESHHSLYPGGSPSPPKTISVASKTSPTRQIPAVPSQNKTLKSSHRDSHQSVETRRESLRTIRSASLSQVDPFSSTYSIDHPHAPPPVFAPPPVLPSEPVLPPPPTHSSHKVLPPPPTLSSHQVLPPPPTLSSHQVLPPPPTLSSHQVLPPPPTLSSHQVLPPPPTLSSHQVLPRPPVKAPPPARTPRPPFYPPPAIPRGQSSQISAVSSDSGDIFEINFPPLPVPPVPQ